MDETKTRTLNLTVKCRASYSSRIEVPADLTLNEAIEYARQRIDEVPIKGGVRYIPGYDSLDIDNCDFSE